MQIDLLRHGETTLSHTLRGHLDDDLTEQGWLQMQSTIQQYITTPVDWDVIISSPLRRCRRFAEHLADQLGLPMRVNEHIKEMYFGDWEGISTQVIYEAEPERLANFWQFPTQYHAPNGESLTQFQQRIFIGFEQIYTQIQEQNGQKALVITHGGVIKLLTCLARQQNLDDLLKMPAELGKLYQLECSKRLDEMYFEEKH
ncbi:MULTISPECIES: histidine phosphatase family protein [unclassified Acinetobacter]|uniref:histidine phosphatase family protein n=1 Tax=unclassified Acinetobacter TaxID=196816 RepID=UPI000B3C718B|nr:histidine phosphatase family protein [Acinetobacter sp. WCHA39]AZM38377.1 histidine phosphatase family protein [Acinetobacter baumannii]